MTTMVADQHCGGPWEPVAAEGGFRGIHISRLIVGALLKSKYNFLKEYRAFVI